MKKLLILSTFTLATLSIFASNLENSTYETGDLFIICATGQGCTTIDDGSDCLAVMVDNDVTDFGCGF